MNCSKCKNPTPPNELAAYKGKCENCANPFDTPTILVIRPRTIPIKTEVKNE